MVGGFGFLAAAAVAWAATCATSVAQPYPSRPITMVVPFLLAVNEGRAASYHDESAIRLVCKCVFVQPNSCSAWIVGIDSVDTSIVRRGAGTP